MKKHHYTPWRKFWVCVLILLAIASAWVGIPLARTLYSHYVQEEQYAEAQEQVREMHSQVATTASASTTTPMPPIVVTEQPTVAPSTTTAVEPTTTTLPPLPTPPALLAPEEFFGGVTFERIGLVDGPLYEGNVTDNDEAALNLGLSHLTSTSFPGGGGNVVVGGHRTSHLRPFYYLDTAQNGDEITVVTTWGVYVYVVYDVWDMVPARTSAEITDLHHAHFVSQDRPGETLTLYACTPEGETTHRIIVHADLVSVNGRPVV